MSLPRSVQSQGKNNNDRANFTWLLQTGFLLLYPIKLFPTISSDIEIDTHTPTHSSPDIEIEIHTQTYSSPDIEIERHTHTHKPAIEIKTHTHTQDSY